MNDTTKLLAERGVTHGEFEEHAYMSQKLKSMMRRGLNWGALTCVQTEALEMIQHKIARILSGDPNHIDHYIDLAGYATLVVQKLESNLQSTNG